MVPPAIKASMVESGPAIVRDVLSQLPPPRPITAVLAAMEDLRRPYQAEGLARATGLSVRSVLRALIGLSKRGKVRRGLDGFYRIGAGAADGQNES